MAAFKRKSLRVVWIVMYEGPGNVSATFDFPAVWRTKKKAQDAIARNKVGTTGYRVERYLRADLVQPKAGN